MGFMGPHEGLNVMYGPGKLDCQHMYTCVYVYVYLYMYIYIRTQDVCMCICGCVYTNTHTRCMHLYIQIYACICMCIHVSVCVYTDLQPRLNMAILSSILDLLTPKGSKYRYGVYIGHKLYCIVNFVRQQ